MLQLLCFAVIQLPDFLKRKVYDVWRVVYWQRILLILRWKL